ncbi:hypothetical protein FM037_02035 [Shewanella psychropiezotolerans]|uniref:VOC domain-containing protein n=1 Tax=Shewanella psychropiezotolerans TaxID=2593655 RepID=A0ABX5WT07_9GAMM|nr:MULTISPECIES: VOC family protein [Shewanella]MPY25915.1 hypothetical protein [Shewanella sp. YLB-07]QDO82239.1 hypothetical protein FM037_02035 [Shewanella psychropiezotolerans]
MNITGLDHFTIRTVHLSQTLDFYQNIIGLIEGERPEFRFVGHWLYASNKPLLHLVEVNPDDAELQAYLGKRDTASGSGMIDHLAFRGHRLAEMQQRLASLAISFRERVVPEIGEHQLFVEDPNGITVEMIFTHDIDNKFVGTPMKNLLFINE